MGELVAYALIALVAFLWGVIATWWVFLGWHVSQFKELTGAYARERDAQNRLIDILHKSNQRLTGVVLDRSREAVEHTTGPAA